MRAPTHRFPDAFQAIEGCYERGWTDGLPVVPPTPERVRAMLDYAGVAPEHVVGEIPARGVVVTAEVVAANAVLAGCLPEYMPVVLAAAAAALDRRANLESNTSSLAGTAQIVLVNGPARRKIGLNCKTAVFGPGYRSNATIGRALRLLVRNIYQLEGPSHDRAPFSQPGRYTWCFGENEEESPWTPLHVQRGFPVSTSTVTFYAANAAVAILDDSSRAPEGILERAAFQLRASGWTLFDGTALPGISAMMVVGPEHGRTIAGAGWTKADIQHFLWPRLTAPPSGWERPAKLAKAEDILVVVAGGDALPQSWWLTPHTSVPVTREIAERKVQLR